ncbi:MAG: reverse transcriptase domain-containing protein, partial [Patescibacteria group bacterium]
MKINNRVFKDIISLENLFSAWDEFKRGKINKIDVQKFEFNLEHNIFDLYYDLSHEVYQHGAYKIFHIHDPKHRIISKATVRDRIVHHAVFKELCQIFDPSFIYHSYSSRIGKGTHLAVLNLEKALRKASKNYYQNVYILKCDIKKFFASIPHKKLLAIIKRKITDQKFLWLIEQVIDSFVSPVDKIPERERERERERVNRRH